MINKTKEDYLRTIYHIQEEKQIKTGVSSVYISKYLNVSKSTVSEMLRKLMKEHIIQPFSYGKIKLTRKGLIHAIDITKKHRLIEAFLSDVLRIKQRNIHDEAHRLEHAFSKASLDSMSKLIKNKKTCPHGKPIPK